MPAETHVRGARIPDLRHVPYRGERLRKEEENTTVVIASEAFFFARGTAKSFKLRGK
jgi:hypothetical protein